MWGRASHAEWNKNRFGLTAPLSWIDFAFSQGQGIVHGASFHTQMQSILYNACSYFSFYRMIFMHVFYMYSCMSVYMWHHMDERTTSNVGFTFHLVWDRVSLLLLLYTPGQVACKLLGCLLTDVCYHILLLQALESQAQAGSYACLASILLPDSCLQPQHTYLWPIVNDPIWSLLFITPKFGKHL